ncbi:hypothetical protein BDB00DRAFT_818959 [Zychaea mexicana]|uniref:uncharacterized protein n=1 Tax=Zychaea mexicana TaxID=64656 RepID=UPI0022FEC279|nr:uncharacterized protein BDB00DRAFT_818959 [Zychaea mexicana]KAI9494382.1 hypothetical protein BDB00DRAFT_818959 [Zychaea mexicana]
MNSFIEDLLAQSPSHDWSVHASPAATAVSGLQQPHSLPPQLRCIPKPMESLSPPTTGNQPVKVRKKPGRKPNPASPALRKAQNRAAQRAFRERKERHLRDLETTIRTLREQRQQTAKELHATKAQLDSFRAENWYLKGLVLTLQFICMHHSIQIPTHSPYLTEEALSEIAQSSPHTIEAYVNAYMRNNINLKPTMAAHIANSYQEQQKEEEEMMTTGNYDDNDDDDDNDDGYPKQEYRDDDDATTTADDQFLSSPPYDSYGEGAGTERLGDSPVGTDEDSDMSYVKEEPKGDYERWLQPSLSTQPSSLPKETTQQTDHRLSSSLASLTPPSAAATTTTNKLSPSPAPADNSSSLSAIQKIRLQLRIQSTLSSIGSSAARLQPTLLQLSISHDPRIDLIPTPHMRDRMIIFRDQMDYDRCFSMLLNGAVYHGGDPTMSESWELPPEFFSEFWFLTIDYDRRKTNNWRRAKGLPEVGPAPDDHPSTTTAAASYYHQQQQYYHDDTNSSSSNNNNNDGSGGDIWSDETLAQFVQGMPTLQPVNQHGTESNNNNYLMSPPASKFDKLNHPLYQIMGSDPQTRQPARAPSLGAIMELVSSMTTTDLNQP